jgi:hypothetical protein
MPFYSDLNKRCISNQLALQRLWNYPFSVAQIRKTSKLLFAKVRKQKTQYKGDQ